MPPSQHARLPFFCCVLVSPCKDRGGEYRSLLGVPGGLSGQLAGPIKEEAAKRGLTLKEGSGGDPDTLMRNMVSAARERSNLKSPSSLLVHAHSSVVFL